MPGTQGVTIVEPMIDGLIKQENQDLRDRVTDLEKKVVDQTDEIVCLKSAVADCLRRLHQLEASKGTYVPRSNPNAAIVHANQCSAASEHMSARPLASVKAHLRHSRLHKPTGLARQRAFQSSSKSAQAANARRLNSTPRAHSSSRADKRHGAGGGGVGGQALTPRGPPAGRPGSNSGRDGGSTGSAEPHSPGGRLSTRGPKNSKEPIFMKDEGILKINLRGRPVNMYAPSDMTDFEVKGIGEVPNENLKLEWVYGYRGRDCRSNVFFLPTGEVVYFVAAVVILYNVEEQMQRHYLGHNDDVKCLAVHPDKITIASGQCAGHDRAEGKKDAARKDINPHVRVWDSVSLNTLHIIGMGDFERSISCISFSKADGSDYLCVVDDSNEHTISVWEWKAGRKVTETKSSSDPVLAVEFNPLEPNSIVTCGKNHLGFWSLDGCQLSKKMGIYEKHDKPKFVLCITFMETGELITGDSNGNIYIWGRGQNKISRAILGAHEGPVFSVCVLKDGHLVSGGGKDRRIVHWDAAFNRSGQEAELPALYGSVRTLSSGPGNTIFVGTTKNCLLQGSLGLDFSPVVEGHQDELWGLAMHPSHHQFLTCAYDCAVSLWDALTHQTVWTRELSDPVHSAAFYPNGELCAVGTQTGRWIVLEVLRKGEILAAHTDGCEQIEAMQYSPDGNMLVLASRDNCLYVYATVEGGRKYSRIGKCSGHSSAALHVDWSSDSQYLRSNSMDYEILFWTAHNCRQVVNASSMRDVSWATNTCTLGFDVAGIWPEGADGTDVNACARSNGRRLVASADDFGKVNLYRFPCPQPHSPKHAYPGHSSHVTNVGFLCDDSRLISTGGKDTAVMQWEVVG